MTQKAADKLQPKRIGFVGLGDQGGPMAMRMIEAGLPVTVWARRAEALEPYRAAGAAIAPDLQKSGAASDFVGVCVVDDAATLEVCETLLTGMEAGSVLAIHSTVHPDTCCKIHDAAAAKGVSVFDAPVSGGGAVAREGRLTVMAGGDADIIAACEPIIRSYAAVVARVGDIGAGQLAKLINNTLLPANQALAEDALALGGRLGLDPKQLATVIGASSGGSVAINLIVKMPPNIPASMRAHGLKLLRKDFGLLMDVAGAAGAPKGVLASTAGDYLDASEASLAD